MAIALFFVVSAGIGLVLGISQKGFNITINHNHNEIKDEKPVEYNESLVNDLDPEVRAYYDHSNGLNKF